MIGLPNGRTDLRKGGEGKNEGEGIGGSKGKREEMAGRGKEGRVEGSREVDKGREKRRKEGGGQDKEESVGRRKRETEGKAK